MPETKKWQPCWCPRLILRELSSIHMQTFSFVSVEKHAADYVSENQQYIASAGFFVLLASFAVQRKE